MTNPLNPYRSLEILAPAGNPACLHAAVRAGANAVYLGCEDFNARRGADNFTLDSLAEACAYAHLRGVKIYMTVNIAIMPEEANKTLELVRQAWRRGVDAFIVQDIGVAAEIKRTLPAARLHVSTQMNTHNVDGIRAAAALDAQRVTLARELTLQEIQEVTAEAHALGMETECFGHGALCVCYSGQCFMSSMIGGRSANRGMCAQACRLPYTLHNAAVRKPLPAPGDHLLSPKDLCSVDLLNDLVATGVDSIKIEGRMKSAEYVFAVVGVYNAVRNRMADAADELLAQAPGATMQQIVDAVADQEVGATDEERQILAEAFSRGFTQGYLVGERGNDIMSYKRPNNRGVFVGRVAQAKGSKVVVASEVSLNEGDVLEFWTNKGHFAETLQNISEVSADEYAFEISRRVNKGDRVFRVRDASMAFVDDVREPRLPVTGSVVMSIGEPLHIYVSNGETHVAFDGPVIEPARTKPVCEEDVREHVDRLGNTPFYFDSLDVFVEDGAGIGFSALHKARTQALKQLEDALIEGTSNRMLPKTEPRAITHPARLGRPKVVAYATNPACARAAKRAGADAVYVPALNYKRGEAQAAGQLTQTAEQAGYPNKCVIALPVVEKESLNAQETPDVWQLVKPEKPVLAENFGQVLRALEQGCEVEVGSHVPATNALTMAALSAMGVSRVWLSPELSLKQIEELGDERPVPLGITIAGFQELMTTEHCLLMSEGPCNQKCSECVRRKSPHFMEDRKGYQFQVVTDACGRSHLYNAVLFDASHLMCELISAGVSAFMVDTTLMNVEQTTKSVARAVRARDIAQSGSNSVSKTEGCTTGHLFRGVQ